MNSIYSVYDIDSLSPDTLVLLDDEHNGICLAMKSNEIFSNIDFKFKKLKFKHDYYGIVLLKLDNLFYNCYVPLNELKEKAMLEKLLYSDYFNLILFNDSKCNKVYRISNKLENKLLMSIPTSVDSTISDNQEIIKELNRLYPPEFLWNN